MRAYEHGRPLADVLAEEEEVTRHLSREAIAALLDPRRYTGLAGALVDRVVAAIRGGPGS